MQLTPVERTILVHLLLEGDDIPGNIGDEEEGPHPASVSRSMGKLEDKGLVRNKGGPVYSLTLQGMTAARNVWKQTRNEE